MVRKWLVFLICGLWPALGTSATDAPCHVQRAAAAGPHVWLLCDRNQLFVSEDEGVSWQARRVPSEEKLRAIALLDSRRGFLAGDRGALLATEDGAASWRQVPLPTDENLTSIHFVGELGWLAGWNGVILHSPDGGRTWSRQHSGVQQGLDSIFFADADHGWAVGWVGTLLRTADGGRTWQQVRTPNAWWSLSSVYFQDASHGWAVGFNGQILHSEDGGLTWESQASPTRAWLTSVVFDNSGHGWITGDDQLLVSEDGGKSWHATPVEGTLFLHQVLPVGDSLWAVGRFGTVKRAGQSREFTALALTPGSDRANDRPDN
jgi:photosystem II stability/assembly factor-like uncharacterized protein